MHQIRMRWVIKKRSILLTHIKHAACFCSPQMLARVAPEKKTHKTDRYRNWLVLFFEVIR